MSIIAHKNGIEGLKNACKTTQIELMTLKMFIGIARMFTQIVQMFIHVAKLKKEDLTNPTTF